MLVVADSSPLIVLVNIDQIKILPRLFGKVIIPPDVGRELAAPQRPEGVRQFVANYPEWLAEQAPASLDPIPHLDAGESSAINLASELRADLLLIDEIRGRQAAVQRGLRITGTIGVLEMAADRSLLDLAEAFERIKQTDFWISHELLDERLKLRRKEK